MDNVLAAHKRLRAEKGLLKPPAAPDLRAAIAELQEAVKRIDNGFTPGHPVKRE